MSQRKAWPEYFMSLAHLVATRATCDRKHVGAIIALDWRIIATGYNGSVPGMPHCDDAGHDMKDGHCVRTIHAEANAIAQAAQYGIPIRGASLFINTFPCWPCFKLIAASGIIEVYYDDMYRSDDRVKACAAAKRISLIGPDAWKAGEPL